MPKITPYQYQGQDSPLTVATQYGISPQQLISANPGGYPFSTGQTINIPQLGTNPIQQPAVYGPPTPAKQGSLWDKITSLGNVPLGSIPVGGTPSPYQPAQNRFQPTATYGPPAPNRVVDLTHNPYQQAQAGIQQALQNEISSAMSSSGGPPSTLSPAAAASLGINPTQAGYLMQNGQWVFNAEYAKQLGVDAQATDISTTGGGDQQQSYDPRNIAYTWNKYAKNPKSRFETNLKWAQNAWRRKKKMAKGERTPGNIVAQQQAEQQTADSVTGFGLVNFSASSG